MPKMILIVFIFAQKSHNCKFFQKDDIIYVNYGNIGCGVSMIKKLVKFSTESVFYWRGGGIHATGGLLQFTYSEKATKFCEIFTLLLSYVVPVKRKVKISQNWVAFSEYMNFS